MNAWNVYDMLAFVECAKLFGMTVHPATVDGTETSVTRPTADPQAVSAIVFNRANGTVAQIGPDGARTALHPRQPQAWYSALGITCNTER